MPTWTELNVVTFLKILKAWTCVAFQKYDLPGADKSLAQPTSLSIVFSVQEQVVVRRGQIRRIGWVIKTSETLVGQFLLGCKYPVSRFLPGRAKDLSAPLYSYFEGDNTLKCDFV
jgi:hypothetical protein